MPLKYYYFLSREAQIFIPNTQYLYIILYRATFLSATHWHSCRQMLHVRNNTVNLLDELSPVKENYIKNKAAIQNYYCMVWTNRELNVI